MPRLKYRKEASLVPGRKTKEITKNEVYRNESNHTKYLQDTDKNPNFGFQCLNYAVSESSGFIAIKVTSKKAGQCGVRTIEIAEGASAGKDFMPVDQILQFSKAETKEVQVQVIDDEQWEPDKEFKVELYDVTDKASLTGKDTVCVVLILDDDKPGFLSFGHGNNQVKHVASEKNCSITVQRTKGSDGKITCNYRTISVQNSTGRVAKDGEDYVH